MRFTALAPSCGELQRIPVMRADGPVVCHEKAGRAQQGVVSLRKPQMSGEQQSRGAHIIGVLQQLFEDREARAITLGQQRLDLLDRRLRGGLEGGHKNSVTVPRYSRSSIRK